MADFTLMAGLSAAQMKIRKDGKTELISIKRPFYRDVLEVHWLDRHYTVVRSGIVQRIAKIYKNGSYLGIVREKLGLMTHFDVFRKAKMALSLHEHETVLNQEFNIRKGRKDFGSLHTIGVYVPLLSNMGKGLEGQFSGLKPEDEEILVLAIIAIGV